MLIFVSKVKYDFGFYFLYEGENMISDVKIEKLLKSCHAMRQILLTLNLDDKDRRDLESRIVQVLKKLVISKTLYGRRIISIVGQQGAGKSTLLRNIYDLDDDVLIVCEGRGEKIPVILSEHKSETIKYLAMKVSSDKNTNTFFHEVEITKDEFMNYSKDSESDVIYVELKVPHKHQLDDTSAFMLLPGLEDTKSIWQDMVEYSISCSDSCIFAFSSSMVAGSDLVTTFDKTKRIIGSDAKPVYAITFSETIMDNEILKKETSDSIAKAFALTDDDSDRIVFVGNKGQANDSWIKALISSCSKYIQSTEITRKRQEEYLINLIRVELMKLHYDIREMSMKLNANFKFEKLEVNGLIREFERETKKTRELLEDNLNRSFVYHIDANKREIDEKFKNKDLKDSFLETLKLKLFHESAKSIISKEETLRSLMFEEIDGLQQSRTLLGFNNALSNTSNVSFEKIKEKFTPNNGNLLTNNVTINPSNIEKRDTSYQFSVIQDVYQILSINEVSNQERFQLESNSMKDIGKLISWFGTYAFINQVETHLNNTKSKSQNFESDNVVLPSLQEISTESKNIIIGLMGVLGVDYLPDQKLNLVTVVAEALKLSEAMVYGIFGATGVAVIFTKLMRENNRRSISELDSFRTAINSYYSDATEICLREYDNFMAGLKNKIVDFVELSSNTERSEIKIFNLNLLLEQIGRDMDDVSNQLSKKPFDFESIIV